MIIKVLCLNPTYSEASAINSKYKPGENLKSLRDLEKRGRTPVYDEHKKRREVIVTETGWEDFKQLAKDVGLSASELIERLERGNGTACRSLWAEWRQGCKMTEVQLIRVRDQAAVPVELVLLNAKPIEDFRSSWKEQLRTSSDDDPYWDWERKYRMYLARGEGVYEGYAIECEAMTQGIIILQSEGCRSQEPWSSTVILHSG